MKIINAANVIKPKDTMLDKFWTEENVVTDNGYSEISCFNKKKGNNQTESLHWTCFMLRDK
jgi:hypothetical protein